MGNFLSCTRPCRGKKSAKVILPTGEIRRLNVPVEAAELMFEWPDFFLVNSWSLKIGRRFSALNADQDLELANVYVMFPMNRHNSIVTKDDVGWWTKSDAKCGGKSRDYVAEESGEVSKEVVVVGPKMKLDWFEDYCSTEFKYRMSMSRSRKPLLETIVELEEDREPYY